MKENKSKVKMIIEYTNGLKKYFVIAVITTILGIIFNYLTPQVIRITVDSIIGNTPFNLPNYILNTIDNLGEREFLRQNLYIPATIGVVFSVLSGICNYFYKVYMAKASDGTIKNLRDKLYNHISRLPFSWHMKNPTGDIIQRCTSDMEVVKSFLGIQLLEFIRIIFLITISLTLMFSMNVKLSLIAVAFILIVIAYSVIFYSLIQKKFKVADEAEGELSTLVQENFTGVRVVRAFGRQSYEIERFDEKNIGFSRLWIKLGHVLSFYWGIGDLFSGLQVMSIVVFGCFETVSGALTLGELLAFIFYNSMLVWPVRSLGRIISEMGKAGVSINRIKEILDAEEEKDNEDAITPDINGDIEFKNVKFDYYGTKPVLKDVSFKIKKGSTFGILGGTGSGKSTIVHLLNRLYNLDENCGEILINGVNIKNIKLDYLRHNIGVVLQEPFLFSKTIKQNINIASKIDEIENFESIKHVSQVSHVHENILGFSKGYDTIVGERGVTLSGGQKQRVAIARTLIKNSPVIVFDDSLSAVDTETDAKIRHELKKHVKDSTVIIISHRITTLMSCDNIIVLDDGKVIESGNHESLIKTNGLYKKVYDMQSSVENELIDTLNEDTGGEK
ncbi:ABC transporter ATP-binding protein [[Eubacterium] tenue]|nr:ABC transporter ATP-binding protein [[Eubacterium] tenue]MBC8630157.1 ABC transporter ATP-binding protein [[Eubacterium] tenue]